MAEVGRVLNELLDFLAERTASIDSRVGRLDANADDNRRLLGENGRKWAGMGIVSKSLLRKPDSLLDIHAIYLQELYVALSRKEAWTFARQLLAEISAEMAELKGIVDGLSSDTRDALTRVEAALERRLAEGPNDDYRRHLIRLYDPERVRSVAKGLATNEQEQRQHTAQVRAALVAKLGDNRTFSAFRDRNAQTALIDTIETVSEQTAKIAHTNLVSDTRDRILGTSIIQKLRDRYGSDNQALRGHYVSKEYMNESERRILDSIRALP